MIFLGIDPGTASCGFAFVESVNDQLYAKHFGVITTSPKTPMQDRLLKIHSDLNAMINFFHPQVIGIEKLFFGKNSTTAIPVAQARGVILLAAAQNNLDLFEFSPNEVKLSVTGYGRADKHQVISSVTNLFNLNHPPQPDDAADALALAATTFRAFEA